MSTRGAYGFRMGGKQWIVYNQYDSYFEGLGQSVANWATKYTPEEVKKVLPEVEIYDQDEINDDLFSFLVSKKMSDDSDFLDDKLFCEYSYILDVDKKQMITFVNAYDLEFVLPWDDKIAAAFKSKSFEVKKEYRNY